MVVFCAVLCDCDGFTDMKDFAQTQLAGANSLTLHVDSVPEPLRALPGALGLAFLTLRRRHRVLAA